MTEQRPEDNEQAPNEPGVWVEDTASGLTYEPAVWVDTPAAIDPDRQGALIKEQSHVKDLGSVQEPDLGGVPQPGLADPSRPLDLNFLYEESGSPQDSVYDQITPTDPITPSDRFDPSEYVALNPQPLPPDPPPDLPFDLNSTEASYVTGSSSVGDPYLTDPSLTEDPATADQDLGEGF
jgi:hypothetical protein